LGQHYTPTAELRQYGIFTVFITQDGADNQLPHRVERWAVHRTAYRSTLPNAASCALHGAAHALAAAQTSREGGGTHIRN
jgi:hypothetical protein